MASCRSRCSWSRRRSSSTGGAPSPPPSAAPCRSTSRSTPAASRPRSRSGSRPTTRSCAARPGSSRTPDEVTREEFRRYVGAVHAGKAYDELQATAFFLRVPPGGLAAHERSVREGGFPRLPRSPGGGPRPVHDRPLHRALHGDEPPAPLFGTDPFTEPARRAAMEFARDRGQVATTRRVTLVQETGTDVQPGVIIVFPVYAGGKVPGDGEARREALTGWIVPRSA